MVVNMLEEIELEKVKERISDILEALTKEGINVDDLKIFKCSFIPMRIHHIVHELGKKGYILKSTVIVDGNLLLIAVRTSDKDLKLVPDYNRFST